MSDPLIYLPTKSMFRDSPSLSNMLFQSHLLGFIDRIMSDFGFIRMSTSVGKNIHNPTTLRYALDVLISSGNLDQVVTLVFENTTPNSAILFGFLTCDQHSVNGKHAFLDKHHEDELLKFEKDVRDNLALPLLVDISEKFELPTPPSFVGLPTDLKIEVLKFINGDDMANLVCVNSEFKDLVCDKDLWKNKFNEHRSKLVQVVHVFILKDPFSET